MSNFEFRLPDIGEGVSEGEVVEWHVKVGDRVAEDDPMVEITTDKASVTIGAPRAGVIRELRFGVGKVAKVGDVLVVIEVGDAKAAAAAAPQPTAKKDEGPAATAVGDIRDGLPGSNFFRRSPAAPATHAGNGNGHGHGNGNGNGGRAAVVAGPASSPPIAPSAAGGASSWAPSPVMTRASGQMQSVEFFHEKPLATPATRKLARSMDVDLRHVKPSGPHGRVTKGDVMAFAEGGLHSRGATLPMIGLDPGPREERKPFVGIRRKIAQRMQQSKNTAAHFTFVEECDVGRLIDLRDRLAPAAAEHGVKMTFLPFVVKAVVDALKRHPILNSALDEANNELVYRRYYDIGVAAATDRGLMVPVVRDADRRSLLDIGHEIQRLGEGAREGTLTPQELSGSTFTITSLGKAGGLFATPILNYPEVGILGVHQIKERPVVRNGQIVIGQVMLLSLSFDHRIVDGHVGAAFAYDVIAVLENPERLFLNLA